MYKFINANASTQIFDGCGVLHTIVINGLTTAGDIGIRDGDIGTFPYIFPILWGDTVAVIHLDPTTSVSVQPVTLLYDIECTGGLYLDFDATLVADLTVSYR